jgi:hypothetical protein
LLELTRLRKSCEHILSFDALLVKTALNILKTSKKLR